MDQNLSRRIILALGTLTSNSKHTPGSWTIIPNGSEASFTIKEYGNNGPGEFMANCRLIESTPDMLLALQYLDLWMENSASGVRDYGMETLKKLIKDTLVKAGGSS